MNAPAGNILLTLPAGALLVVVVSAAVNNIDASFFHMVNKTILFVDTPAELSLKISF